MVLTLLLVWAGWFIANLATNGLFYIVAHQSPALCLPAEMLYYAGRFDFTLVDTFHPPV